MAKRAKDPGKRVLYGEANYKNMVLENGYYVDKTEYIRLLENYKNPVFLRPRRFGKSLLCTMLEYYYDINEKENFEQLFGHTAIGQKPTPLHNNCMILSLDFSVIDPSGGIEDIKKRFNQSCNMRIQSVRRRYRDYFEEPMAIDLESDAAKNLEYLLLLIKDYDLPKLYVIIDEYDNFANQLITSHQDTLYRDLTADNSFFKNFFKTLKNGFKTGAIARTFVTGVLPITIDDLSSGFNIADFITLEKDFEAMMGFTLKETETLLDDIYRDHDLDPATRDLVMEVIIANYNGYRFIDTDGDGLFNSTILMYFLRKLINARKVTEYLIDVNLKTDISWVKRLTASNPARIEELVNQLLIHNRLPYNNLALSEKFNMSQFFDKSFYPVSFYYLGMLTKHDDQYMCLPNQNMRSIFADYFNDLYKIDLNTRYAEIMAGFIKHPDIPALFAGYWREYISQLPEAIFQQVNENFYRTTFFELCRQHLSEYFTFAVEKSYPGGRTDLEFVGKFDNRFSNLRFLLEFKYYSNAQLAKTGNTIDQFKAPEKDIAQLKTYEVEWKKEHPGLGNKSFLVYCFGNQGFKVFPV